MTFSNKYINVNQSFIMNRQPLSYAFDNGRQYMACSRIHSLLLYKITQETIDLKGSCMPTV